ncbi:MAG: hypothetical protein JNJ83_13350 [Verrucomicrobiaceae bacterium]|nr:hypothetical protein [Verrucomicrobiaceae bacterium]
MQLADIKSVLSFAAFRPDADDPETPMARRFEGRKMLALNISRTQVTWRGFTRKGKLDSFGIQDGDFADVAAARAEEWRSLSDGGWCAVSINNRFIISLENGLMRADNTPHLLRTNPRMVLGPKFDRGKRYAICHHPASTASMLLATEDSMVRVTEDVMRGLGLRPARVCCGLFALIEHAIGNIYASGKSSTTGNFVLIAACEGSIAALSEQEHQWRDLRCRSGLGTDGVETALQIISPLVAKAPPGTPVYFISEGLPDSAFRKDLMEQLERVGARDLTQDDLIWKLVAQH